MKYILLSLAVLITMAACQNKDDSVSNIPIVPVYNSSALSDTARTDEAMEPAFAKSQPKRSPVKRAMHKAVHRNTTSETTYPSPVATSPVITPVPTSPDVN